MQNLRLNDGTVRCPDCFDASTYEGETPEPCLYCGSTPQEDKGAPLSKIVSRPVTPAPSGTLCGYWHSYGPNSRSGYGCMSGKTGPGTAVHVLTTDRPIAPAGTPLCAFHSPYA